MSSRGPLCDAVLERTGSAAVLERMEASNLLLVPLDRQRRWYRYHHLFQACSVMSWSAGNQRPAPRSRGARPQWCEANGLPDGAVHYAQLAGDAGRVGRILLRNGMRLYALGRAAALRSWFAWLAEHGPVDGGAAVLAAWLSLLSGRAADAERWAAVAGAAPQDAELPDGSPLQGMGAHPPRGHGPGRAARCAATLSRPCSSCPRAASGGRPPHRLLGTAELLQGNLDAADQHLAESGTNSARPLPARPQPAWHSPPAR